MDDRQGSRGTQPPSQSQPGSVSSNNHARGVGTNPPVGPTQQCIVPRTTQYEPHPLLQERRQEGLSEIELFLKEKDAELASCDRDKMAEPQPSTSNADNSSGRRASNRSSFSRIMPRTSQYEKHALLQERSPSGLSEIELFLQEKENMLKDSDQTDSSNACKDDDTVELLNNSQSSIKQPLLPRSAKWEPNVLFQRNESGLSGLEEYLLERDKLSSCDDSSSMRNDRRESTASSKLQPRSALYEENALLQRDEEGLSAIEKYLQEKEQLLDEQENCDNIVTTYVDLSRKDPNTSSKRVRFKQSEVSETDTDDVQLKDEDSKQSSFGCCIKWRTQKTSSHNSEGEPNDNGDLKEKSPGICCL